MFRRTKLQRLLQKSIRDKEDIEMSPAQNIIAGAELALRAMGIKNEKQRQNLLDQFTQLQIAHQTLGMEQVRERG